MPLYIMEDTLEPKKKKNYSSLISLITIIFIFVLIIVISNSGVPGKNINITELETMVNNGEISQIYIQSNGVGLVRKTGSQIDEKNFPSKADYNFEFISYASISFVDEYNDTVREFNVNLKKYNAGEIDHNTENDALYANKTEKALVVKTEKNPSASIIETIAPYVSIIVMIVIGYLLFKMFSGKGGGVGAFNKSRAKLVEKSNIRFADVAGADEEKEEVQEIVEFLKNPMKFKSLGARIPKGVLLVGPPGTGKTLLAKAVAGESNVPFLSITGSDFVELYVGVGAGRVRDLFETAKKCAPCIVFIDEIDAVGRQRGAGLGGGNDEREQTLNQLLTEMDGFQANDGVIVLAATNRADVLDPALLRPGRFDRQIYVNVPDVRGREGILAIYAKNKPLSSDVDLKVVARLTSGFTGADIENVLNEAAILAARNGDCNITMEHITEGINKVLMGPQKKSRLITENTKKLTAYHEAGHAILAKKLDCGDQVHEVSIIPRGMAGGYTSTRPSDDDEHYTLEKLNNRICMIMGGRLAEQIALKDISAGASSDISKATQIARKMVTEWGMSEKLGFISFDSKNEVFIGRDYQTQVNYSEATAATIDAEIKRIIDYNYERGYKILTENLDILDNFAKLLIEKETIYTKEVDQVMAGVDYKTICKQIDKDNRERMKRDHAAKLKHDHDQLVRMQKLKQQTTDALRDAGVISQAEYDNIKRQEEHLRQEGELAKQMFYEEKERLDAEKKAEKERKKAELEEKRAAKTAAQGDKPNDTKKPAKRKTETSETKIETAEPTENKNDKIDENKDK